MPEQDPTCSWTETHAILAKMRGLQVVAEDGSKETPGRLTSVPSNIAMPTVKEIQDRGKGDDVAKSDHYHPNPLVRDSSCTPR